MYFYINGKQINYLNELWVPLTFGRNSKFISVIEYLETKGVVLPHYCYHKTLSIAGNCRMCLIEIKKSPKPIISCAMSATSGIKPDSEIFTNSPLVKKSRESVLEFLLLNHPLDCPVCDQGGECDLQDQSLFFGFTKKRFYSLKRVVSEKNLGPIVKTVMTRCIHCTRCVRFADEIAGVETLGVFGRGVNSEIGTYVNKPFQSELSGNIIDLCPVGALTTKPYPFTFRNWELSSSKSYGIGDGFGENIFVFAKENTIVKILPYYQTNNWITDKNRFIFDGMFSAKRVENGVLINKQNFETNVSWENLLRNITNIFYYEDHLFKHYLKKKPLIVVLGSSVSIETIGLLDILSKKYSFIEISGINNTKIINDLQENFSIKKSIDPNYLKKMTSCLLIGTNPRYDGNLFERVLRKRFLKGGFRIFSVGSKTNDIVPKNHLGVCSNTLKEISEGTHEYCKFLVREKMIIISNSGLFGRNDFRSLMKMMQQISSKISRGLVEILCLSINTNGINYLNKYEPISLGQFKKLFCLMFLGQEKTKSFKKLLELNILGYSSAKRVKSCTLIDQSSTVENLELKSEIGAKNYIYLPNSVFFETSDSFINTSGDLCKTQKILEPLESTKTHWEFLRRCLFYCKSISFLSDIKQNYRLSFNCNSLYIFRNYLSFIFLVTKSLSNNSFFLENRYIENKTKPKIKYSSKTIYLMTIFKKIIEDYYIDGLDGYSQNSLLMIECSKSLRYENTNFSYNKKY